MRERGTEELRQKLRLLTAPEKLVSTLSALEVRSAIRRRLRSGDLLESDGTQVLLALSGLLSGMTAIVLSEAMVEKASGLVDSHRLKSLDALQLACAIHFLESTRKQIVFVASDTFLLEAAQREGLMTWNPERLIGE